MTVNLDESRTDAKQLTNKPLYENELSAQVIGRLLMLVCGFRHYQYLQ